MVSTAVDYAKFAVALANRGLGANGNRIISAESIERMHQVEMRVDDLKCEFTCVQGADYSYGLGVRTRIRPTEWGLSVGEFGWDGAAGSYLMVDPIKNISVVIGMHLDGSLHGKAFGDRQADLRRIVWLKRRKYMNVTKAKNGPLAFKFIRTMVAVFSPKMEVLGLENLPDEPVIIVGNHAQMYGPIACELYLPDNVYTWCAGQMMELKEVPAYAFEDFWSQKPRYNRWAYKVLSYLIAPLSVLVFNSARTIAVYRDKRILTTFRQTIAALQDGRSVVVFPEHNKPFNHIIHEFQDRFIDLAKLYYRRTGKEVAFVPLYIAPGLSKMCLGEPIRFCADADMEQERGRICTQLMDRVTDMAQNLPRHRVVPYPNIPKRDYPMNVSGEVEA